MKKETKLPEQKAPKRWRDLLFSYTWSDLERLQWLRDFWTAGYLATGLAAFVVDPLSDRPASGMLGAMLACFPSYLIGLWMQRLNDPDSIDREHLMVWQLRNLAVVFTVGGLFHLHKQFF